MERYQLDLSEFFDDHRRKVFVQQRPEWKTVKSVLQHVRTLFNIQDAVYLTDAASIYYPEDEDLIIVKAADNLKLRRCTGSTEATPAATTRSETVTPNSIEDLEDLLANTPVKRKRIRKRKNKNNVAKSEDVAPPLPNGTQTKSQSHIKFDDQSLESDEMDDEEDTTTAPAVATELQQDRNQNAKAETVRNVNSTTVARIIRGISPPVPEANGAVEPVEVVEPMLPTVPDAIATQAPIVSAVTG